MLFFTFQSKEAVEMLESEGTYILKEYTKDANSNGVVGYELENEVGYKPIFVTPMNESNKLDFLVRLVMSSPTCPQRAIIFESDEFDKVNYASWLKLLGRRTKETHLSLPHKEVDLLINSDDGYVEYVVPKITKSNVKEIINVTDCNNSLPFLGKTISDYSLDFIYSDEALKLINKYFTNKELHLLDISTLSEEDGEEFMDLMLKHLNFPTERNIQAFYSFIKDELVG